jgi:hypothetical protein
MATIFGQPELVGHLVLGSPNDFDTFLGAARVCWTPFVWSLCFGQPEFSGHLFRQPEFVGYLFMDNPICWTPCVGQRELFVHLLLDSPNLNTFFGQPELFGHLFLDKANCGTAGPLNDASGRSTLGCSMLLPVLPEPVLDRFWPET